MTSETPTHSPELRTLDLDIQGMTCASCVGRVERKLGKLPGVTASVNLPLESAKVQVPAGISDDELISTVKAAGYGASLKPEAKAPVHHEEHEHGGHEHLVPNHLLRRLVVSAVFTIPLFIISMVPAAQFPHWGWVAFALATPVVLYGAWPFHKAAAINARHLAST
ncbi:carbonate dehydratase, partial [Escherichia coli]|nr:carbonate dehydratase [Escherichia coli]